MTYVVGVLPEYSQAQKAYNLPEITEGQPANTWLPNLHDTWYAKQCRTAGCRLAGTCQQPLANMRHHDSGCASGVIL
jgi:hypothetical protein